MTVISKIIYPFFHRNLRDMDVFSKSDPICVVSTKPFGSHNYMEIKRTECIDNNLNPQWVTKVRKRVLQRKSQKWKVFLSASLAC